MQKQLISIIIPCYNASEFIENTISTVLTQTYSNFELIIINDGSTDNSEVIIEKIAKLDPRIKYYHQQNGGVSSARNHGLKIANGEILAILDSDDFWKSNNLEKKLETLNSSNLVDWVFCDIDLVDQEGAIITTLLGDDSDLLNDLLIMEQPIVPGVCSNIIFKRKCINSVEFPFDPNLSTSADRDFAIQLASKFIGIRIPEILVQCLKYGGNMSENVTLYEKDMLYLLNKNKSQLLYLNQSILRRSFSNFYSSMFLAARKNQKLKSLKYFALMILMRPFSLLSVISKLTKSSS